MRSRRCLGSIDSERPLTAASIPRERWQTPRRCRWMRPLERVVGPKADGARWLADSPPMTSGAFVLFFPSPDAGTPPGDYGAASASLDALAHRMAGRRPSGENRSHGTRGAGIRVYRRHARRGRATASRAGLDHWAPTKDSRCSTPQWRRAGRRLVCDGNWTARHGQACRSGTLPGDLRRPSRETAEGRRPRAR